MHFSKILDEYMNKNGITNYKMSQDTGISDSLIGYWRNSKRKPTLDNLVLISEYLSLSLDYLVKGNLDSSILLDTLCDNSFSEDEMELLETYKELDSRGKHKVQATAYDELDRVNGKIVHEKISKDVG